MNRVVYDTAVLVACDRNERKVWAEHRVRLESGRVPLVPSVVVAQASRSPKQVQLRRFLRGCEVVALGEADAHRVGALLGKSRTSDVVDACVVALAAERHADVVSGDIDDAKRLVDASRARIVIFRP